MGRKVTILLCIDRVDKNLISQLRKLRGELFVGKMLNMENSAKSLKKRLGKSERNTDKDIYVSKWRNCCKQ